MGDFEIKRNLFAIFEYARMLFNDYYNGFNHNYTNEDKKVMLSLVSLISNDIDNVKELLEYDTNL